MPPLPLRTRDDVLFGAKKSKKDPPAPPEVQSAIDSFSVMEDATADDCKAVGNLCYQNEMYGTAIQYYTKAIERCPDNAVHFSNRSAAYLNSSLFAGPSLALKDAIKAIEFNPTWFKGYVRKADALFVQEKLEAAEVAYQEALALNKTCSIAIESLAECRERMGKNSKSSSAAPNFSSKPFAADGGGIPTPPPFSQRKDLPPAPPSIPTNLEDGRIRDPSSTTQERNPNIPTPEETGTKIASWSTDTVVDLGATATRRYKASVAEADRELGRTIKEQMMGKYRTKLTSDEIKKEEVLKAREEMQLHGATFDYKRSSTEANRTKSYSKGTDDVGHAISADCYQSYTQKDKKTW